jgi:hypothetical protein
MVSTTAASNSNMSNENFVIRELIVKLGNIGNCSDEISQTLVAANSYINSNNNTSCYNTPLNSPPKLNISTMAMNSTVAEFSTDHGFAACYAFEAVCVFCLSFEVPRKLTAEGVFRYFTGVFQLKHMCEQQFSIS